MHSLLLNFVSNKIQVSFILTKHKLVFSDCKGYKHLNKFVEIYDIGTSYFQNYVLYCENKMNLLSYYEFLYIAVLSVFYQLKSIKKSFRSVINLMLLYL